LVALALGNTAQAADFKAKKIAEAPPAVTSWTGFYAGFGLGFRTARTDVTTTSETFAGIPVNFAQVASSLPFDGTAFRTNPYIGFNWQITSRWVAGVESDVGFTSQATTLGGYAFSPAAAPGSFVAADSLAVKTTADGSLRGRFGILLAPVTLAYL